MSWRLVAPELIEAVRSQYALDWNGYHGYHHWERVRDIGFTLAPITGANSRIVEYFALFHDAKRENDDHDPLHGIRGARFAREFSGNGLDLLPSEVDLLCFAIRHHHEGETHSDPTVATCWDSDRLDLGRVGIVPDPEYLNTDAAQDPEMIRWAFQRSIRPRRAYLPLGREADSS